ncbi:hypothetical protein [Aliivibrio finisterrensis]|uniref:Uncharacterized protein n=1 Tax=Aliivibrio finisterrensis TaxID=511998 RepID=A0ABY0I8L0_9GAMM|nr:hypothetical protein [Aliivibrio finisterrensis]RYU64262.1 hypothetical protein ERW53_09980 [Aliivibrio finisterrensis]RYU83874.1 hypothetical protein ERW52_11820 [Aliivibrio finisterrensis]
MARNPTNSISSGKLRIIFMLISMRQWKYNLLTVLLLLPVWILLYAIKAEFYQVALMSIIIFLLATDCYSRHIYDNVNKEDRVKSVLSLAISQSSLIKFIVFGRQKN